MDGFEPSPCDRLAVSAIPDWEAAKHVDRAEVRGLGRNIVGKKMGSKAGDRAVEPVDLSFPTPPVLFIFLPQIFLPNQRGVPWPTLPGGSHCQTAQE